MATVRLDVTTKRRRGSVLRRRGSASEGPTKPVEPPRFQIRAFVNGLQPGIDPDKMNPLLDQLEAEDVVRKHQG